MVLLIVVAFSGQARPAGWEIYFAERLPWVLGLFACLLLATSIALVFLTLQIARCNQQQIDRATKTIPKASAELRSRVDV